MGGAVIFYTAIGCHWLPLAVIFLHCHWLPLAVIFYTAIGAAIGCHFLHCHWLPLAVIFYTAIGCHWLSFSTLPLAGIFLRGLRGNLAAVAIIFCHHIRNHGQHCHFGCGYDDRIT
jgi:hypothetical protein